MPTPKITPLDVSQKQFRKGFRGLDPREVEAFLIEVAATLESMVLEMASLRGDVQRKEEEIHLLRGRERALQATLVTAQKACEDIRESARKEAEIALSEAELQAEKIVQNAHGRFVQMVEDINELKRQRVQFEAGVRSMVESHLKLLEAFREPLRDEAAVPFLAKGS
jgi:cell division initiation protein